MAEILVADDNPLSLHFFSEALALVGHRATTAEDGKRALQLALERPFRLLLLDARMPGLDGRQVLAAIRASAGPCQATPALATTAEVAIDPRILLDSGFVEILVKPIGLAAFHTAIAGHLPQGRLGHRCADLLDDALALAKTGGDVSITRALRGLFISELGALPAELDQFAVSGDHSAFLDRLHRLDASAGFCGAPALAVAIAEVRVQLRTDPAWPIAAIGQLLEVSVRTREAMDARLAG